MGRSGSEGTPNREWANLMVKSRTGTWELVVYSSAALSVYGRRIPIIG